MQTDHRAKQGLPSQLATPVRPRLGPGSHFVPGVLAAANRYPAQSRNFSWTPWKRTPAVGEAGAPAPGAAEQAVPLEAASTSVTPPPVAQAGAPAVDAGSAAAAPLDRASAQALAPTLDTSALPPATDIPDAAALLPQSPASGATPPLHELIAANPGDLPSVLNSPEAVSAVMQMSDLKLIGLDHSFVNPAGWIRDIMTFAHVETGLPW